MRTVIIHFKNGLEPQEVRVYTDEVAVMNSVGGVLMMLRRKRFVRFPYAELDRWELV